MNKKLLITGAVFGVLGIVLGAFAAHGLEKLVNQEAIKSFETGVRYQMYHAFLLLLLGGTSFLSKKLKSYVFLLVVLGVLFFSGSIFGLATNDLSSFDFTSIALITPLGGLLLILAWVLMLIGIIKNKVD
ncbi:DUF423 domain-containing protein [Winogradskyella sp. DF17]|jgi:uncharacterized membrane protein YgdD (TMEM256/DUF423 family)|uniref:DUF423 domain-containing protein n=1 Tax=Winogradskyella pelagia TaxID=2819984 RepID=A0ABS3T5A7_9FLAO|nr:DUF423 domain-containing protein [Winogradskyella sp. DF17]MBO3117923.1 DUF423 domain-containing protein [Winogradskyella sp. DF17]